MITETQPKAKWVLVHDDGKCANGQKLTPLVDGVCPACKFPPDMQSTCFVFYCPADNVPLNRDGRCPTCQIVFDRKR